MSDYDYTCYISSNFTDFEESHKSGVCLFDLITLDLIKNSGLHYKLILSVELTKKQITKAIEIKKKGKRVNWKDL